MPDAVNRLTTFEELPQSGEAIELSPEAIETAQPFVGRWRVLESTTNWERGRIIWQWRSELEAAGLEATEYSDHAWAQLVGGVSGQHVGRLRRTFQRFGETFAEYPGLYWSHFLAALDWEDAPMWLEGARQSAWSVSQMRSQRWEALGQIDGPPLTADDTPWIEGEDAASSSSFDDDGRGSDWRPDPKTPADQAQRTSGQREKTGSDEAEREGDYGPSDPSSRQQPGFHEPSPQRPFAELPKLPEDVAEAFEQFKLVLLRHKLLGWEEISRDGFVAVLQSLQQLALAPGGDEE